MLTETTTYKADFFFILGTGDPEMNAIETILKHYKLPYAYAGSVNNKGHLRGQLARTHAGVAYKATHVIDYQRRTFAFYPERWKIVCIECMFEDLEIFQLIDHTQNPQGNNPEYYLEASSIGQFLEFLEEFCDIRDAHEVVGGMDKVRIIAASAHCPGHAFRGMCEGVTPEDLIDFRISQKARYHNVPYQEMLDTFYAAVESIKKLPYIEYKGFKVRDAKGSEISCLPDGLIILGEAAEYMNVDDRGKVKVGLIGATEPDLVKAWVEEAKEKGYYGIYHDPERGYAGAYTTLDELEEEFED